MQSSIRSFHLQWNFNGPPCCCHKTILFLLHCSYFRFVLIIVQRKIFMFLRATFWAIESFADGTGKNQWTVMAFQMEYNNKLCITKYINICIRATCYAFRGEHENNLNDATDGAAWRGAMIKVRLIFWSICSIRVFMDEISSSKFIYSSRVFTKLAILKGNKC